MRKLLVFVILLNSCVSDKLHELVVIKNMSSKTVTVIFSHKDTISDSILFYGSKYTIASDSIESIYVLGYNYKDVNFFVFDTDSVYASINNREVKGIIEKSLLKKISIPTENLSKNDTIVIK